MNRRHAAGIQKPVQECGPSPPLPSDHVLGSGAVWFPGVFDQHGCPLIIFPADGQDRLLELSKAEVVDFIHYFHALLNKKQEKQSLVSMVADLRHASPPTTRFITEILLLLEEHKQTVHSVYIIQPKKKDVGKLLLKLLVPSKSYTASFRNILLKDIPELWNYIDRSQLPASLGGYFMYCHSSFICFIKEIDAFVQEFLSVVQRLPLCISTLQGLSRLPLPSNFNELQHFCSTNEAKFLQLRRELGLDELLKHCETVCEKLHHPEREPCYQAMAGTPFFTQTAFDMPQNHSRITAAVEKVELLWQQAFAKAHLHLRVLQLNSDALQITVKMESLQEKLQLYRMEVVKDSTRAAMLLSEFEASIYTPAMALVRCAEDVIHTLEEILPVTFQTRECWALDLERQKENLYSAVHLILQTFRAVSSYHNYYNKANRWYSLVLSDCFLPELLSGVYGEQQNNNNLRTVPAWRQRLSTFLKKNPPPGMEELLHLSHLSSAIPDNEVQQAGRRLFQRCMILRKLLISSGPVSVEQLQLALQWQYELLRTNHGNLNCESDEGSSEAHWPPSELNHAIYGNGLEAGNHPVTLLSPTAFAQASADWSTQLEPPGGKDDVENLRKLTGTSDPMRAIPGQSNIQEESISSISDSEHYRNEFGFGPAANFSSTSIQIIPKVEAESLNLEIKVKRLAAPPTNPWLSLPVDDLENSYTVTITPKLTPQKNKASCQQSPECSIIAEQESGSSERLTDMEVLSCAEPREPQSIDLMLQAHSGLDDPELSPICNILSSTITDGRDKSICGTEGVSSLLWDSYDLHDEKPEADSMNDMLLMDWEVKEQENLKEVERILNTADGILEEEENVLAQEAVLDALLRERNGKDLWPQWRSEEQLDKASIELTEAGGLSFEDRLQPGGSDQLIEVASTESVRESETCSDVDDHFSTESENTEEQLNSRLDLLNEMRNVHVLDQLIIEENLKIHELRLSKGDSNDQSAPFTSLSSVTNAKREAFWLQLEREKSRVEKLEKSLDEAHEREDMAPDSEECFVLESETDRETTDELLSEGSRSGCNDAMHPHAKDVIKKKQLLSQGHDVSGSDCELSLCDTCRVFSFCDLKESSVVVQPPILCGKELAEGAPCDTENKSTSELWTHGEFDPGGKLNPLPVSEVETGSLPVNSLPAEHETPLTSKASEHPADAQLDLATEALGVLLESVTINCREGFLYPNVKEHINNNNNNLLVHGNYENFSEMTNVDQQDPSMVSAGLRQKDAQQTEADLQSVLQMGPSQPLEFDPGGKEELKEDFPDAVQSSDSVRISDHVAQRVQTQLWEDNIVEIADFKIPVVLDIGSGLMKAGFANQVLPNILFPTITGVPKYEEIMNGTLERDLYIGHDAQHMRGVLTLKHPIKNGIICNWDDMEKIWHYTFQQLSVDPEEHPVLLTEAAMNPLENRQRMVEIMFERFGVPFAYIAMQAVLALYAAGRTTGVVFDSGEGVSHSVPVFEGYGLPHAVQRLPLAGLDVTLQLKKLLQEQGVSMRTTAEDEIVREMKEKCCCVALNYEAELNPGKSSCREMQYTMPDGQIITLGTERFRAPEILFKPEMIGRDHYGMHESIFKSILRSDIDLRRSLLGNIVLSGGNTLLPGLPERLQTEIENLVPADMRVNVCVTSPKDRDFLVWTGGAALANLSTFSSAWISQGEYEEYGSQIVFRKCF